MPTTIRPEENCILNDTEKSNYRCLEEELFVNYSIYFTLFITALYILFNAIMFGKKMLYRAYCKITGISEYRDTVEFLKCKIV